MQPSLKIERFAMLEGKGRRQSNTILSLNEYYIDNALHIMIRGGLSNSKIHKDDTKCIL